jgi:hypothetical protein
MEDQQGVVRTSVTLYPVHEQIVREFAEADSRSFSNALQFIITDWVALKRAAIRAAAPVELQEEIA